MGRVQDVYVEEKVENKVGVNLGGMGNCDDI